MGNDPLRYYTIDRLLDELGAELPLVTIKFEDDEHSEESYAEVFGDPDEYKFIIHIASSYRNAINELVMRYIHEDKPVPFEYITRLLQLLGELEEAALRKDCLSVHVISFEIELLLEEYFSNQYS